MWPINIPYKFHTNILLNQLNFLSSVLTDKSTVTYVIVILSPLNTHTSTQATIPTSIQTIQYLSIHSQFLFHP